MVSRKPLVGIPFCPSLPVFGGIHRPVWSLLQEIDFGDERVPVALAVEIEEAVFIVGAVAVCGADLLDDSLSGGVFVVEEF